MTKYIICEDCEKEIPTEEKYTLDDGTHICKECTTYYPKCDACKYPVIDNLYKVQNINKNTEKYVCAYCLEYVGEKCQLCEEYFELGTLNQDNICYNCIIEQKEIEYRYVEYREMVGL